MKAFKAPSAIIFNPVWIIVIQTLFALAIVSGSKYFSLNYVYFVLTPAVIYYLFSMNLKYLRKPLQRQYRFSSEAYIFASSIIILVLISNLMLSYILIGLYGGLGSVISNLGSTNKIVEIQFNSPKLVSQLIALNYFMPIVVVPIVLNNSVRKAFTLLLIPLLTLLIVAILFGARILFIDVLVAILIVRSLVYGFSLKNFVKFTYFVIGILLCVVVVQSVRQKSSLMDGIIGIEKYYSVSLEHGALVISREETAQPLYWTLRSVFSVPYLSSGLGTKTVYEGIFGKIPLVTRGDDFTYAAKLGADPNFNTFSIYGYSFLDLGYWGVIIILGSYLIIQYLYVIFLSGTTFGLLLFPSMYVLLIDQLRTNSIFSLRAAFFIIASVIISIIAYLFDKKRIRSLRKMELSVNIS